MITNPSTARSILRVFAAAAVAIAMAASAQAQLTWDADGLTPLNDGPGTWNTTTVRWIGSSGTTTWTDSNTARAVFGVGSGSAGNITVTGNRTLNTLTFNAPGFTNTSYNIGGTVNSGTITLAGSNPTITANHTVVVSSVVAGSSGLIYNGVSSFRNFQLRGNNTYSGITDIRSGRLAAWSSGALGATGSGNHTVLTGTATSTTGSTTQNVTIGYGVGTFVSTAEEFVASGTGALTGNPTAAGIGTGAIFFMGNSGTVSGAVTIGSDSVSELRIGTQTGTYAVAGTVSGGVSTAFNNKILSLNASGTVTTSLTIATNPINLPGSGSRLTVMSAEQTDGTALSQVILAVAGNTVGTTEISSGGKLRTDVANAFSNTMAVQIGSGSTGGTWNLNGFNQSIGNLQSAGSLASGSAVITSAAAATLSVNQTGTTAYNAALEGGLSLVKSGAGRLTLGGANSYSGTTAVDAGVLSIASTGALPGWNVAGRWSVAGGAALTVGDSVTDSDFQALLATGNYGSAAATGFDTTTNRTYGSTIADTGAGALGLTKLGSGTLTLAVANTYTGTTAVNAGVLAVDNGSALGTSGAVTFGGGTLRYTANSTTADISSRIGGSGSAISIDSNGETITFAGGLASTNTGGLTKLGSGTLALSAANSYTGNTTVNAGVLQIGSNGAAGGLAAASAISGSSGATLAFARTDDYGGAFANAISGGLGVRLASGSLTLSTSNAYTGGTRINGGTLILSNTSAAGTGPVQLAGGGLSLGYVSSTSTYRFSGINVAAGDSGTLTVSGSASTAVTYATGTISVDGGLTVRRPTGGTGSTTFSSPLVGSGTLTVENTNGGLVPTGSGGRALFPTTSTFTGSVIVRDGGNLAYQATTPTLASADINAGGYLTLIDGRTVSIASLAGAGTVFRNGGLNPISLIVQGGTFSGPIRQSSVIETDFSTGVGAISLTKNSADTLVLSGSSTFTGGSTITAGTLRVRHANALGSSTAALAVNGGTLDLDGTSISVGALSGSAGAVITTGNTAGTATLTSAVASGTSVFGGVIQDNGSGVVALTKSGAGVLALTGANTFTGATTISAGGIGIVDVNSLQNTSGVNIADGAAFGWGGGAATFARNITVTSGTGTVGNVGGGLLTLAGTLTKNGTVLRLTGGQFNVTGQIVGLDPNSDLVVNGTSTVTLSNTNSYNGPTFVNQASTLIVGINNAIPSNSTVTLGDATSTGTLDLGTFTNQIGGLVFSGSGGTVRMAANQTASPQLSTSSTLTLGSNASLDLTGMATTAGNYRLISYTSRSGTFDSANVTGLNSAYLLRYDTVNANEISAQRKAEFGTITATPAVATIITGGSTAFSYTVANATPTDGSTLSFTSSNNANVAGASTGTAGANATSASISGLVFTGTGVGLNQTGSFTLADPNAIGSPANGSVSVNVLNHSLASFAAIDTATKTLDFGSYDAGNWSGGDGGNGTLAYSVFNIASLGFSNAETAGLNLYDWAFTSGDDVFSVGFSEFANLAAGGSNGLFATVVSPGGLAEGSYSGTYTLKFRDQQDLSGATNTRDLSLTMNMVVVPEPGAIALAAIGIAAAAWARRRSR